MLSGVTRDMRITHEETFGPVAPVMRFETEAEALRHGQRHREWAAAYLFSRDLGPDVWRVGEALEFGVVAVNTGAFSYEGAPFGGMKESGFGREGSRHGMDEFLDMKYLCVDGIG